MAREMTKTNNLRMLLLMLVSFVLSAIPTLHAEGKVIMLHPHERIINPNDTIGARKLLSVIRHFTVMTMLELHAGNMVYICI